MVDAYCYKVINSVMKIMNIVYNFQCIFQDRSITYTARDKAGNENACVTNIKLVGMVMLCDINYNAIK